MRLLESITDSMDMNLSKHGEMVKDREAWLLRSMVLQSQTQLSCGTAATTKADTNAS